MSLQEVVMISAVGPLAPPSLLDILTQQRTTLSFFTQKTPQNAPKTPQREKDTVEGGAKPYLYDTM